MKAKDKICECYEESLPVYNWDLNQYVCENCGNVVLMEEDELDSYYKPEKKLRVRKFKENRSQ